MPDSKAREAADLLKYLRVRVIGRMSPRERPSSLTEDSFERIRAWCSASTDAPRLTICIPTRDRLDLLLPCLGSLAVTCEETPAEVIIADTGSRPETLELLDTLGLRVVSIPGRFNFSRACNHAARSGTAPILLFLNNDTEAISHGWAEQLTSTALQQVVGAALVYPGTRRLQHAGVKVVSGGGLLRPNAYRPPRHLRGDAEYAVENIGLGKQVRALALQADVMAVTGAFLGTSREHFELLGGFDAGYRDDLQDLDYCLRARAAGIDVVCHRDIVFSHHHAGSRGRYEFPIDDWRRFVSRWEPQLARWLAA